MDRGAQPLAWRSGVVDAAAPDDAVRAWRVSRAVNEVRRDGPELLEAIEADSGRAEPLRRSQTLRGHARETDSRVFRDTMYAEMCVRRLRRAGVSVLSITQEFGSDRRTPPRIVNGPMMLAGIARCQVCGAGLTLRTG